MVGTSNSFPCYSCVVFFSGRINLALIWSRPSRKKKGGMCCLSPQVRAGDPRAALPKLPSAPHPPQQTLEEPQEFTPPVRDDAEEPQQFTSPARDVRWTLKGEAQARCGCHMPEGPGQEQLEDEQALPPAPGETRPASVLGKCSHGQKSRLLVRVSYLHATPFKNRLQLNQKHVFRFVPILSLCFLSPALLLHQLQRCCQGGRRPPRPGRAPFVV